MKEAAWVRPADLVRDIFPPFAASLELLAEKGVQT
jgi:hypothetical protein